MYNIGKFVKVSCQSKINIVQKIKIIFDTFQ